MSQEDTSSPFVPLLLTFLSGVAIGAVITALVTPKSGPELRGDLKDAAARAKLKAEALAREASVTWDDLKGRTRLAAADFKRGLAASVNDLKQPVEAREEPVSGTDPQPS
jgi:gas vesicle protein